MKKTLSLIVASLLVMFGLSAVSFGQTRTKPKSWSVNSREHRQQKRIVQGVKSGELTAKETYRLERRQAQIRRQEARYRASGNGLSWRERYKLERSLNHSSRAIRHQKHDKQDYNRTRKKL